MISFTAEQLNSGLQDGKIIGVELPEIKIELTNKFENIKKYNSPIYISRIDPSEIDKWVSENKIEYQAETKAEIETILKLNENANTNQEKETEVKQNIVIGGGNLEGTHWKGVLVNVSGGDKKKRSSDFEITLNKNGVLILNSKDQDEDEDDNEADLPRTWSQESNIVKVFGESKEDGYYEFELTEDTLVFRKIVIAGEEIIAGSDFMGGIAPVGTLYKQ